MEKQGKRSNRLVLVPGSFRGHLNPMLQLGTILYSQGFSIIRPLLREYTSFNFASQCQCKAPFQECLARLTEKQNSDEEKISCIIYDELVYFSEAVATEMKLPSIILRIGGITAFMSRDAIVPQAEGNNFLQVSNSTSNYRSWIKRGSARILSPQVKGSTFFEIRVITQVVKELRNTRKSSAIIYNTIDFLEQSSLARTLQQFHLPLFSIGPLHKFAPALSSILFDEDISCMRWLDEQTNDNTIIYVSLGSITQIYENELAEMACGLANSNQPFLWVVRPGSVRGSEWIESLPEGFEEAVGQRGCIVKWAPQKQVLAHAKVGGFWSHCGWNSTMESISEGVPIICRPNSGDQRVNGRYISNVRRVGLEMENELNRREVERAVRRLMVDKEGLEIG
ncbi:hypothetical protein Patl1_31327 [Pistacia atlantica]|uniref:Uncharacterized protein n=1 Tax=Pistacia atlantica TaxID=434234 RepID=A0ACC1ABS0_9ROSI|nr:hypothetical protein Patl1_31327 [Pistacia atlantica]